MGAPIYFTLAHHIQIFFWLMVPVVIGLRYLTIKFPQVDMKLYHHVENVTAIRSRQQKVITREFPRSYRSTGSGQH